MRLDPPCAVVNLAWAGSSLRVWHLYRAALRDPATTQERVLLRCLKANRDTAVGRLYGFSTIRSVVEYQDRVPLTSYDTLEPFVDRIASGEPHILTRATVRRLVPSSGSTAAAKLIPYTDELQREIRRAVGAWLVDLFRRRPSLIGGPAYWSISPAISVQNQRRVPVGFDDDSQYLGGIQASLARAVLAVPPEVRQIDDVETFRVATLLHLLRARELRLISVWHPTFLTGLLDALRSRWGPLIDALARSDSRRAGELQKTEPDELRRIWPRLQLVSCWSDGPANASAQDLKRRLQDLEIQAKGLIATEAVVTIPFEESRPLAIRSHFFEFVDPLGRVHLAHELEEGISYSVVVTTGGGLYRYRLFDRVAVSGRVASTPSLRFMGKDDRVSDRFGEKLSDGFVASVVDSLFAGRQRPRFSMLAPEQGAAGFAYTLFVELDEIEAALPEDLERGLRRNPHYAWCVDLGQLRPSRVVRVRSGAMAAYLNRCVARGQRLGEVKPVSLHPDTGWSEILPC